MRRFNMRLGNSPRDRAIADTLECMTRQGQNASEWVKETLFAASQARVAGEGLEPEDAAQALRSLAQRFK